jgi:hypothetical protein
MNYSQRNLFNISASISLCAKVTPLEFPDICLIKKNMAQMAPPYGLLG